MVASKTQRSSYKLTCPGTVDTQSLHLKMPQCQQHCQSKPSAEVLGGAASPWPLGTFCSVPGSGGTEEVWKAPVGKWGRGFAMHKEIRRGGFEKGRIYSSVVFNVQEPLWQLNQQHHVSGLWRCVGKYRVMQLPFRERLGPDIAIGLGFKG